MSRCLILVILFCSLCSGSLTINIMILYHQPKLFEFSIHVFYKVTTKSVFSINKRERLLITSKITNYIKEIKGKNLGSYLHVLE
jgi:hypothetical protein